MYNFYQLADCVSISPPRVGDKNTKICWKNHLPSQTMTDLMNNTFQNFL